MKYHLLALAAALALSTPFVGAANLALPTEKTAWIVGFHEMPEIEVGDDYYGATVISTTPQGTFVTVETENFDVFSLRASFDDNVKWIETDVSDATLHFTPNDYFVNHASNYGMNKIGLPTAWDKTLGSTSIKDGHIDSGIFKTHEDLQGSRFLTGWDYKNNDNNPNDESSCSWHGSHTIGTVAATINNGKGFPGTAQITVLPVKIFGGTGCAAATNTNIANAIYYVGNQGSHISSNSWGGGAFNTAINNAINTARGQGVIFIASAGNGACNNCVGQPWVSQEANVIIVTATDSNDAAYTSNSKGWQTDVSAPGVSTGSAGGPNVNSYWIMTGTSMAAPYVAGVAALIKTLNPTFTEAQVQSRIKSTALDLGTPGEDDTFGAGRIRANLAVY